MLTAKTGFPLAAYGVKTARWQLRSPPPQKKCTKNPPGRRRLRWGGGEGWGGGGGGSQLGDLPQVALAATFAAWAWILYMWPFLGWFRRCLQALRGVALQSSWPKARATVATHLLPVMDPETSNPESQVMPRRCSRRRPLRERVPVLGIQKHWAPLAAAQLQVTSIQLKAPYPKEVDTMHPSELKGDFFSLGSNFEVQRGSIGPPC